MIYLDAAATSKYSNIDDIIINTMTNAMNQYWMNPSSIYASKVKEEINKCRTNIAKFIGSKSDEIIFTSGASESNNQAIRGWSDEVWLKTFKTPCIISTHIEHKSILKLLEESNLDALVKYCDVDESGIVDCESLEELLIINNRKPILVSIGLANNEIGVIQPIKKISDLIHKYGGILHVDATQAFGKIAINVEELGVDLMSASGHKISPVLKGVGFLYKKSDVNIQPLIYGTQENNLRGGTENTFSIIGLSKAIEYCDVNDETIREMYSRRDYFIGCLEAKFGCKLNGHPVKRLPNNISVTFPHNVTGESLLYMLDMSEIFISTGSACNSKSIKPSHVLKAINLSDEDVMKTIRITLPKNITYEEIDKVIEEIDKTIKIIES